MMDNDMKMLKATALFIESKAAQHVSEESA